MTGSCLSSPPVAAHVVVRQGRRHAARHGQRCRLREARHGVLPQGGHRCWGQGIPRRGKIIDDEINAASVACCRIYLRSESEPGISQVLRRVLQLLIPCLVTVQRQMGHHHISRSYFRQTDIKRSGNASIDIMSKFFKLMVVGVLLCYFLIVEVVSMLYSLKNPYIIYFGTNLFNGGLD
eukprot:XP_023157096.1 uncharacterized protein LOC100275899 isoform X1 [Zea mays]